MNIDWNVVISLFGTLIALSPVFLRIFILLNQKTENTTMKNLSERAQIIVAAMEQTGMTNEDKKDAAYQKLAQYAQQSGIKVTGQQIDDFIESAVNFLKHVNQ